MMDPSKSPRCKDKQKTGNEQETRPVFIGLGIKKVITMHLFSPWQTEANFALLIWLNEKAHFNGMASDGPGVHHISGISI